ncbi:MAG: NAD(P)-dependent dehydrogenase (short-subunit alcohol dehydrogenase family) [Gammaproteobacteria bacterium]|jgi:NAD(P)-dependent dehydrogenase (short-subunit alcohol dehydrogenase family)
MKQAIVTGAGAGLGESVALRLHEEGYRVGVLDINKEQADSVVSRLKNAIALQADVTLEESVKAAFEAFGEVPDLLVNNAGIVRFGALHEQSVAEFQQTVNINLVGVYIAARTAAIKMIKRGSGNIINMTSVNAISPSPGVGAYPAAKAGVAKMTEQMAIEWGPLGLRVNSIAPGFIDAGMSVPIYADPKVRALRGGAVPSKRLGTAEDITNAVIFLSSEQASYINGHQLVVDGGVVNAGMAHLPRE